MAEQDKIHGGPFSPATGLHAPGDGPHQAPVATGESGTTTEAERRRLATHHPTPTEQLSPDPRRESGYAGYQSGAQLVGDQSKAENAHAPFGPFHADPVPRPATAKGMDVVVVATISDVALVVRADEWALLQAGTMSHIGVSLVKAQDVVTTT